MRTFRTVFWSVFGRGETNVVTLNKYENHVTEDFGYLLYGFYNVIMVTVLINMLIAMMARSYQAIAVRLSIVYYVFTSFPSGYVLLFFKMVCTTVVKKTFNQQQYIVKQYFLPKKATEYNMIINKTTDIHVLGLN